MAKKKSGSDATFDLTKFGGIPVVPIGARPGDIAPADQMWNFGVSGRPGLMNAEIVPDSAPALYNVAPHVQGMWDGKTTICCYDAVRKVLGKHLPAQHQPRGTCGGRTARRAGQLLQCVMIAGGKRAKYRDVSHAWPYAIARAEYGLTGSGPNDDGVPDGSIPVTLAKYGILTADESGDTKYYGAGSDNLAVKWGARRSAIPSEFWQMAADNKVEANLVKVRTFQEMADGFAAGGVGLVSSARGFTMTRDAKGRCRPQGTWYHYMAVSGVTVIDGRANGVLDQSWGENTPSGPTIEEGRWPDYSFAADRDTMEQDMIARRGVSLHMIFGFPLWDEDAVIDWRDI